mgnify:CR=1 FL=1
MDDFQKVLEVATAAEDEVTVQEAQKQIAITYAELGRRMYRYVCFAHGAYHSSVADPHPLRLSLFFSLVSSTAILHTCCLPGIKTSLNLLCCLTDPYVTTPMLLLCTYLVVTCIET